VRFETSTSCGRTVGPVGDPLHWDDRYRSIGARGVSWFEDRPTTSLELLDAVGALPAQSVIDVGGGASNLVDALLAAGCPDITVLDLSAEALATARDRVTDDSRVTWKQADLLDWEPGRRWDIWHDRAVLHFLVLDDDRAMYLDRLRRSLAPKGAFVIGAFAEDGPTECSGLPVQRYGPDDLLRLLGDVEIIEQQRHVHTTPAGIAQPFNWIAGRL